MIKPASKKMKKIWRKLLIAWTKHKSKKAIKLQHKLLREELKRKAD